MQRLSVEQALKVIDKGGDVAMIYRDGNVFDGRYEINDANRAQLTLLDTNPDNDVKVLDWVTGEYADL
jgi:hypothetical protein